jgi:hypothetical protein
MSTEDEERRRKKTAEASQVFISNGFSNKKLCPPRTKSAGERRLLQQASQVVILERWLFQQAIPAEDEERMLQRAKSSISMASPTSLPAEDEERRRKKIAIAAVARHFRWRLFQQAIPCRGRRLPMKEEELMLQPAQSLSLMAC